MIILIFISMNWHLFELFLVNMDLGFVFYASSFRSFISLKFFMRINNWLKYLICRSIWLNFFYFMHEKLTGYFKNLLIVYFVDFVYESNINGFKCAMSDSNLLTLTVSKRDIVIRSIWWYTLILIYLFPLVFLFSLRHTSFDKHRFSFIGELWF